MNLQELFQKSGMKVGELAAACGKSKATVSQVLGGKYQGRKEVVEEIRVVLERKCGIEAGETTPPCPPQGGNDEQMVVIREQRAADCEQKAPGKVEMWWTPGQKQAWLLLDLVRKQRDFAVLVGKSGVGKTWVANRYNEKQGGDYYTAQLGQSLGGLLSDLCRLWGLPAEGGNDAKQARLRQAARGRFLIVDEADLLIGNRTRRHVLRMVEVFRQLYEAGAGVVLVGLPALHISLSDAGETYVFSRIGYLRQLGAPPDELLAVHWRSLVGQYEDAVGKTGPVIAHAKRAGFFRYLEKLAELVKIYSGDVEEALGLMFRPV
jgi:DNA transposition AAA+ family ATPase